MRDAIALAGLLDDGNVKAFLHAIRVGEGTADENGYRRLFGGELFESSSDHPRRVVTKLHGSTPISSTAAGAYQFLSRTWDECAAALGLADFAPKNQDLAALFLIDRRSALDDVLAGRFADAVRKCAREWASLPGSPYGQPTRRMAQALATYKEAGGVLAPQPETIMAPFVAAALPSLIQAAPALIRAFGDSPQAERNARAAEVVAGIAKEATGETTLEGAVNAIADEPAKAAAYREAVHQSMGDIMSLTVQVSDAEDKSRAAALDRNIQLASASGGKWLWLLGGLAALIIVASYIITWQVLFGAGVTLSDETKALVIGQIVILGFATVVGFLYGASISSRIRDAQQQQQR